MNKIGFLGPEGTFSQEAMESYYGKTAYSPVACNSIPDLLMAVENRDLQEAIVPVESSIEGAVSATLDMLAWDVNLKIRDEAVLEISQNLLVRQGTGYEDIKCIISHPQPLGQCRRFLSAKLPAVEFKLVNSTAGAAREVSEGAGGTAAIASRAAAGVYNLEILQENIQDRSSSFTRFAVIAREWGERTGNDKTSIVFSTEDRPGSLYRILDIFNLWDINLTRIESRPAKDSLGKYIFFVDIRGHLEDDDVRDALTMVKRKTSFFKFLGSYPSCMD